MADDYEARLGRAMDELDRSAIHRMNYAPPLFWLAKGIGLKPRPPHYMSFWRAALLLGPAFGLTWGLVMWALGWQDDGLPVMVAILASLLAGALFGLAMAAYYRWAGGQAGLSRWEDL